MFRVTASIAIIWKARPRINWGLLTEQDGTSRQNTVWLYIGPRFGLIWYTICCTIWGCSHLWAGAPQYQLEPFDRIQRRAIRIIGDPMICERLDTLTLRRDVSSLCVLYRIYHGECSEELFDLLPAAEFSNRTVRHKLKYHPHHLDTWQSTTVRFRRNFLPRALELCWPTHGSVSRSI